jgi:cytoskeletal protein CcmA (bactofilin family)
MFSREPKQSARIDTLVGKAARVQGDIEFEGGLHLDGRVAGNVRAVGPPGASLSISEHGSIEGSVEVPNVTLNGSVRGDIYATERVILGPQARVHGNVHYGVIEMTLGAEIKGKLVPLPSGTTATIQSVPPAAAVKSG